ALLNEAGDLPTPQMMDVTDAALHKTVELRDGLIEHLRSPLSDPEATDWRHALDTVNVALSEMASVEYPGALNREHLDDARKLLEQLTG
ncbi:MAG TPA: hypothetical protein VFS62_15540, partial [Chloroflexota bacterium]|nr:hypothetical protein [Chloroflexota bacterium]